MFRFSESRAHVAAALAEVSKSACPAVVLLQAAAFMDGRGTPVRRTHEFQPLHGQGVGDNSDQYEGAKMSHQTHVMNMVGMVGTGKRTTS